MAGSRGVDFNLVIGLVLRYGVLLSFVIICVGSVLLFWEGQTGFAPVDTSEHLIRGDNHFLAKVPQLVQGALEGKPYSIMGIGLLVLLATPIARVAISVVLFAMERRFAFVAITIAVLAVLLFSTFVIGPATSG